KVARVQIRRDELPNDGLVAPDLHLDRGVDDVLMAEQRQGPRAQRYQRQARDVDERIQEGLVPERAALRQPKLPGAAADAVDLATADPKVHRPRVPTGDPF